MKRLTEKIFVNNKFSHYAPKWKGTTNSLNPVFLNYTKEIIQKYGQLEDIEDELGIDLITVFKALTDGFYYKDEFGDIEHLDKEILHLLVGKKFQELKEQIKDYGKTWALTKEELL